MNLFTLRKKSWNKICKETPLITLGIFCVAARDAAPLITLGILSVAARDATPLITLGILSVAARDAAPARRFSRPEYGSYSLLNIIIQKIMKHCDSLMQKCWLIGR